MLQKHKANIKSLVIGYNFKNDIGKHIILIEFVIIVNE